MADAQRILTEADCPHSVIVSVDSDSILYLNALGRPRTLWLHRSPNTGKLTVRMAPGFAVDPPEDWY